MLDTTYQALRKWIIDTFEPDEKHVYDLGTGAIKHEFEGTGFHTNHLYRKDVELTLHYLGFKVARVGADGQVYFHMRERRKREPA